MSRMCTESEGFLLLENLFIVFYAVHVKFHGILTEVSRFMKLRVKIMKLNNQKCTCAVPKVCHKNGTVQAENKYEISIKLFIFLSSS